MLNFDENHKKVDFKELFKKNKNKILAGVLAVNTLLFSGCTLNDYSFGNKDNNQTIEYVDSNYGVEDITKFIYYKNNDGETISAIGLPYEVEPIGFGEDQNYYNDEQLVYIKPEYVKTVNENLKSNSDGVVWKDCNVIIDDVANCEFLDSTDTYRNNMYFTIKYDDCEIMSPFVSTGDDYIVTIGATSNGDIGYVVSGNWANSKGESYNRIFYKSTDEELTNTCSVPVRKFVKHYFFNHPNASEIDAASIFNDQYLWQMYYTLNLALPNIEKEQTGNFVVKPALMQDVIVNGVSVPSRSIDFVDNRDVTSVRCYDGNKLIELGHFNFRLEDVFYPDEVIPVDLADLLEFKGIKDENKPIELSFEELENMYVEYAHHLSNDMNISR